MTTYDEIVARVLAGAEAAQARVQAAAGADIIAPSDMMDGRVGRIRAALPTLGLK